MPVTITLTIMLLANHTCRAQGITENYVIQMMNTIGVGLLKSHKVSKLEESTST